MIKISQEEFEKYILDLINKRITRVELARKLGTDTRTLSNKIYGITNEKLLEQYIKVYPYRPGQNKNIDYEALIIELLQHKKSVIEMQQKYGIAERTYRRKIERVKISNNRLYLIYKKYIRGEVSDDELDYINSLEGKTVRFSNSVEDRKAELMCFFMMYKELLNSGLTKEQAMMELGETSKSIKRKSDELERIKKEEKLHKNNNYKNSLKVEGIKPIKLEETSKTAEIEVIEEGRTH